jgi:hypothetical protein
MKQTAIQWLEIEIKNEDHHTEGELGNACIDVNTLLMLVEQAREMEKEQIVDFAYVIADDLACGVFRDKEAMEKRYDEFLVFRSEEE